MGSIPMQDAFFSAAVTEGGVYPAFHPPGVGKMGTVILSQEKTWGKSTKYKREKEMNIIMGCSTQ